MSLPRGRPDQWAIVAGEKGLKAGEPVTFFYPSTHEQQVRVELEVLVGLGTVLDRRVRFGRRLREVG
jgi:hypothetical protein